MCACAREHEEMNAREVDEGEGGGYYHMYHPGHDFLCTCATTPGTELTTTTGSCQLQTVTPTTPSHGPLLLVHQLRIQTIIMTDEAMMLPFFTQVCFSDITLL